ncbi:MAG: hypothetical protein R6U50_14605 [Desulfobacterales bacterium]
MKLRMFGLMIVLVFCFGIVGVYADERIKTITAPNTPNNKLEITIENGVVVKGQVNYSGNRQAYTQIPETEVQIKSANEQALHRITDIMAEEIEIVTSSPGCTWYYHSGVWYRVCD